MENKNLFENIVPISHGHEVRKEKALEQGDLHGADKEEVEALLLEIRMATDHDQELESRAKKLIEELESYRDAYKGYQNLIEAEECQQMIIKIEEALVTLAEKK